MSPTLSFFRMMLGPLAPSLHPNRLSLWSAMSHLFVNNKKTFQKSNSKMPISKNKNDCCLEMQGLEWQWTCNFNDK